MKRIFITCIIFSYGLMVNGQDILRLVVNNKNIGEVKLDNVTPLVLQANKAKYKKSKSAFLIYKQQQPVAVYRKSMEITDEKDNLILNIEESSTTPGRFSISSSMVIKKIFAHPSIKLYLMLSPKNEMMAMPSRRNLLVELHMK